MMFEKPPNIFAAFATILAVTLLGPASVPGTNAHEMTQANGETINYTNWVNRDGRGCCNNHDCRPIPPGYERTNNGRLEVYVVGEGVAAGQAEWCPVTPQHYLSRGNAPDGSHSHYCIWERAGTTPCAQLLCYQPQTLH
jgi:hypothetical protein